MHLANKFNFDEFCSVTERQICSDCGRKRMFFCYDCKVYVGCVGSMAPRVKLPLLVDIIKHRHELNSKSTAIHALLISPAQTRIFDKFEEVPNYALEFSPNENVAVLFPSKNSQSIDQFVRDNGPLRRIVVLDSTWNTVGQLRNMGRIAKLPMVHLRQYTTDYWRPQNGLPADHLATIEAIYYACLESREAEANWRRRRRKEKGEGEKRDGGEHGWEKEEQGNSGRESQQEREGEESGRRNDEEEKEREGNEGRDKEENGRSNDEEEDELDNLLFWFYFFRKMVPERKFLMKK